jgi:hypothetical protein
MSNARNSRIFRKRVSKQQADPTKQEGDAVVLVT